MISSENRPPLFGIMRQALLENIVYDASGQLVSGSFMDYAMPRADNFCSFALAENEVPTQTNPLGVKGAGEFGTVGALPAVMNAINSALARIGAPLGAGAGNAGEGVAGDEGGAGERECEAIGG